MDVVGLPAVARVPSDDLPAVQRAVLRRRVQGAARRVVGGRRVDDPSIVPQLGLPDPSPDLRGRSPRVGRVSVMCRHLAWLGRPRTLAELMLQPEYGLLSQSYRPRRQEHGLLNADGWGVGFYPAAGSVPARWRSSRPLW